MLKIEKQPKLGDSVNYLAQQGSNSIVLGFSNTLLLLWGNPPEEKLLEVVAAFINKFGFREELKTLTSYDVQTGINDYLAWLKGEKTDNAGS